VINPQVLWTGSIFRSSFYTWDFFDGTVHSCVKESLGVLACELIFYLLLPMLLRDLDRQQHMSSHWHQGLIMKAMLWWVLRLNPSLETTALVSLFKLVSHRDCGHYVQGSHKVLHQQPCNSLDDRHWPWGSDQAVTRGVWWWTKSSVAWTIET